MRGHRGREPSWKSLFQCGEPHPLIPDTCLLWLGYYGCLVLRERERDFVHAQNQSYFLDLDIERRFQD